jgi:ABC-type lipoprotein release transport system permease subunit
MKIKAWINKHAKEILIGVIVSIITAGIMKGFEWIAEIAPTAGNSVWRFFSNTFYTSAAKMTETSLITFLFSALIGIGIVYVYILLSKALGTTKKAITNAEELLDDINNPKPKVHTESKEITEDENLYNQSNICNHSYSYCCYSDSLNNCCLCDKNMIKECL